MISLLIVDDEHIIRKGLKAIINEAYPNIEIYEAENGEEGLELAKEMKIDVIICDIRMPKMSGLMMLQMIREFNTELKAIILSGYDDFNYCKKAVNLKAENYLLKPVDEEELIHTLNNILLLKPESSISQKVDKQIKKNNQMVTQIKKEIRENYASIKTLEELAKKYNYSAKHLSKIFKKETGINFSDYLNNIKIEKAKILLKDMKNNVQFISIEVGFNNQRYFSAIFKKHTGMTPTEYRNKLL